MTFRPLWPLAMYIVNYDYIANVLCENKDIPEMKCNGKCYLSKMIARDREQNKENPFETSVLKVDQIPILVLELNSFHFLSNTSEATENKPQDQTKELIDLLLVFEITEPPEVHAVNSNA